MGRCRSRRYPASGSCNASPCHPARRPRPAPTGSSSLFREQGAASPGMEGTSPLCPAVPSSWHTQHHHPAEPPLQDLSPLCCHHPLSPRHERSCTCSPNSKGSLKAAHPLHPHCGAWTYGCAMGSCRDTCSRSMGHPVPAPWQSRALGLGMCPRAPLAAGGCSCSAADPPPDLLLSRCPVS